MQGGARGKSKGESNIEKLINSSLDDIVKQTKRERRLRSGNTSNRGPSNSSTRGKKRVSDSSRTFKNSQKRNNRFNSESVRPDNGDKTRGGIRGTRTGGGRIGEGSRRGRTGGREGAAVGIRRSNNVGGKNMNDNFSYRKTNRDKVRNIKIVAKLDDVPAPTAQQKAGISNLEITPRSVLSQRSKGRVF
ncbi:hypothetical protein FG386_001465 [Cryptosporidium ryanae]|uniref:uncharacterized protein n=1 Tax=Cryptosporidium ryanae TaxID=515981 RepID=UPI003519FD0E|nr:hypothetical protein FG386_001465 [Cryptosporidium ryanae]